MVRLWDAQDGTHLKTFIGHTARVSSVAFSPDSNTLVSGSWDGTIRLWDVAIGEHKTTLTGHTGSVKSVTFSPDGSIIASGSSDGTIRLWNATSGTLYKTFVDGTGHTWRGGSSVAFAPNSRMLASGSSDGTIRLWNATSGTLYKTLTGHTGDVESITFSPNGETLASGSADGTVLLWALTPVPLPHPPMYWANTDTGTLHRLVGTEVENLLPGVQNATNLAVDVVNERLYWTEQTGKNTGKIKSANLDGSNVQVLTTLKSIPYSIAVDTMRSNLYWTNSRGRIQRSNLNGKQIRTLVQNLSSPEKIVVDVAGAKLYWTEASGRIRRANLNGKRIQNIVRGLQTLSGIAISGNKLYWTEITGEGSGKIGCANLNGSNFSMLATLRSAPLDIAIDTVGRKLYWTDSNGNIRRANLKGKNIKKVVSGLTSPADLALGGSSAAIAAASANLSLASSEIPTPEATHLLANYPNPFNPETWIPYHLAEPADVSLSIYDVKGLLIRKLTLGPQPAGVYQSKVRAAYWDGRNELGEPVASGVYFYTLSAGDFTATGKMLIRK